MKDGFIKCGELDFNVNIGNNFENSFITEELILTPLYKKITDFPKSIVNMFPIANYKIELYCNECKKRRIYKFASIGRDYFMMQEPLNLGGATFVRHKDGEVQLPLGFKRMIENNQYFYLIAEADCGHNLIILFKIIDYNTIVKVGQSPSIYDMNENINDKPFIKELGEEYASYYKQACSLNSYNSNIGAMTYLRRIFENLLAECFEENSNNIEIEVNEFKGLRMDEKIKKLQKFLPSIIFSDGYNEIYSKISNGIHNLTEEQCEAMFTPLRMAIEEILTEKLEQKQKVKRQSEIGKLLKKI